MILSSPSSCSCQLVPVGHSILSLIVNFYYSPLSFITHRYYFIVKFNRLINGSKEKYQRSQVNTWKKRKEKNNTKYENITQKYNCFHSQILLNDFGFGDFSSWPDMLTGVEKSEPFKKCTWWPVETIV